MRKDNFRRRACMRIDLNCIPTRMPVWTTIICLLADSEWPGYTWVWLTIGAMLWLNWIFSTIYDMPIDIFENYRGMGEDEGVGK